ncbi:rhodanese-like domain-containing protein [Cloacibacillus porcorum]|uniref:sulfurtransferase n=1 Tax=Cloacibacillus porcorum TaxID=1197717 RepID=UPI003F0D3D47
MKKFLTMMLVTALVAGATSAVAATEETKNNDSAADSILSQVQANKAANKEKAGEQKEAAAPKKAEEKKPEAEKAPAPAQKETPKKNEAASTMDQIVKEAAEKAAKEQEASPNNRGTVAVPPAETKKDEPAASAPAKTEPAKTEPAAAVKPAEPAKTAPEQPKAAEPAAPVTPAVTDTAEIPAGRPLKPAAMQAGAPETRESLIVSAEWLKTNRGKVILIDSRPESLYSGGHIPGAVNAPWTYFANMNAKQGTEKWGVIWPAATMAKRIGALGVDGKKMVIAYCDAGGWGQSGWTLWILRQAGIKNAKILEGGIGAWKAAGGQVTKTKNTNKAVAFTIKQYVPNYTATTEWINNNIGKPGLVILDVRTEPEFLGKIRPFQEKRAGHLPGAINIPRESFLTADSHFKPAEEVQALLAQHGVTPDSEIVVYDTAGVRSAFVTMLLRYSGFVKSQSYDEGFQAWAGNPELPLVKP